MIVVWLIPSVSVLLMLESLHHQCETSKAGIRASSWNQIKKMTEWSTYITYGHWLEHLNWKYFSNVILLNSSHFILTKAHHTTPVRLLIDCCQIVLSTLVKVQHVYTVLRNEFYLLRMYLWNVLLDAVIIGTLHVPLGFIQVSSLCTVYHTVVPHEEISSEVLTQWETFMRRVSAKETFFISCHQYWAHIRAVVTIEHRLLPHYWFICSTAPPECSCCRTKFEIHFLQTIPCGFKIAYWDRTQMGNSNIFLNIGDMSNIDLAQPEFFSV